MQGKRQGFDIRILHHGKFSVVKGRAKSIVLTPGWYPWGGAHSRALKAEKSLSQSPHFSEGVCVEGVCVGGDSGYK